MSGDLWTVIAAFVFLLLSLGVPTALAQGDSGEEVRARLARMPRPWTEKMHRLTREQYEETLRYWVDAHPESVAVEQVGTSVKGMGLFLMSITDRGVDAADKQVCLFTSLHGGPERSGTTAALHLAEWLMSADPEAVETRRKQLVLIMPMLNPEAFFETDRFCNAHGIDPYTGVGPQNWDLETLTFKRLDECPEMAAFLSVVDAYRPEVHVDLHGIGLQEFAEDQLGDRTMACGQTMFEITGSAYSNYALRPWDWRVTEAMIEAGLEAGGGSDRFEADAQRCFWGPDMNAINGRLWVGRPRFYTAQYAYAKYHTMLVTMEVGYEACAVARLKGLLRIGNGVWDGACQPGYPVDRVKSFTGHFVTAYGATAQARRKSRIELWEKQGAFTQAMLYPQFDGRDTYICAVGPEAAQVLDRAPQAFLENCRNVRGFNAQALQVFLEEGPEAMVVVSLGSSKENATSQSVENGIGFRLRIPYLQAELLDVRMNGHLLAEDGVDGYQQWGGNGFTQVQVNVPPEKAAESRLFVVTCAYVPGTRRQFGWAPPKAVMERLDQAQP